MVEAFEDFVEVVASEVRFERVGDLLVVAAEVETVCARPSRSAISVFENPSSANDTALGTGAVLAGRHAVRAGIIRVAH